MIQRIQSVYLLLAAIALVVSLWIPLVKIASDSALYEFRGLGLHNTVSWEIELATWGVIGIGGLAALLTFLSIFLFKNRKTQIKLVNMSVVMILFFYITFATYLMSALEKFKAVVNSIEIGIVLPVLALILIFLALRSIRADEKLVRSLNRLR